MLSSMEITLPSEFEDNVFSNDELYYELIFDEIFE